MGCGCFIGSAVILACLLAGLGVGWYAQGAYAKNKHKLDLRRKSPPLPKDINMLGHPHYQALRRLPAPGELRELRGTADAHDEPPTGSSLELWYQLHDEKALLLAGGVHVWLGALSSACNTTLDPDLHSYTSELLGYMRMHSPNLLRMLTRFHETGHLPALTADECVALTSVLTVENVLTFSRAPDDRHMRILANILVTDKSKDHDGGVHKASGGLENTSLTPRDRMERDFGVHLQVQQMQDPRAQLRDFVDRRQNADSPGSNPYGFFPKLCIPTVWHVMQYNSDGYVAPGNAYWQGDKPAVDLITCANRHFDRAGLPFELHLSEWRNNVTEHPYLDMGSFETWQFCAERAEACTTRIAAANNVDVTQAVNIYTVGTAACQNCCRDCASGYVSHLGDSPGIENQRDQHLVMSWDRVDTDIDNSLEVGDKGCGTFTHELAHLLGGLYHTHTGNCSDGDLVADTPANMDGNSVQWRADLNKWCTEFVRDGNPEWSDLAKFDSCKGDAYIDNVFNFMSYNPSSCRMMFSQGQVERMLENMYAYRPNLMQNSMCVPAS